MILFVARVEGLSRYGEWVENSRMAVTERLKADLGLFCTLIIYLYAAICLETGLGKQLSIKSKHVRYIHQRINK